MSPFGGLFRFRVPRFLRVFAGSVVLLLHDAVGHFCMTLSVIDGCRSRPEVGITAPGCRRLLRGVREVRRRSVSRANAGLRGRSATWDTGSGPKLREGTSDAVVPSEVLECERRADRHKPMRTIDTPASRRSRRASFVALGEDQALGRPGNTDEEVMVDSTVSRACAHHWPLSRPMKKTVVLQALSPVDCQQNSVFVEECV